LSVRLKKQPSRRISFKAVCFCLKFERIGLLISLSKALQVEGHKRLVVNSKQTPGTEMKVPFPDPVTKISGKIVSGPTGENNN
jgi:hypothetical protein